MRRRWEEGDDLALSPADLAWQCSATERRAPTASEIAEAVKEGPGFLERTAVGEQHNGGGLVGTEASIHPP